MEYVYAAWEVSFEPTSVRRGQKPKIAGSRSVDSPGRLSFLVDERPDHLMLDLAVQGPGTDEMFEGLLSDAPRGSTFVVEGEEDDLGALAAARNPLEISMMLENGPPRKAWRSRIGWSESAGGWRLD